MGDLTASDVLAMNANKDNGFLEGNGIIILILFFLFMGGGFGGNAAASNALTRAELTEGLNSQTMFNELRSFESSTNSNFNGVTIGMNNGFNSVNSNIAGLGSQMASCCCELKTAVHAEGEATRALIQANTIQQLRDDVAAKDRELLTTGLTAAQVVQTNNLENFIRSAIGCSCSGN